jgi:hypothetical protein
MATFPFDPNALPLLELGTERFRWYPENQLFAAEASTLGTSAADTWWLQRLYRDNPLPQGICLRSHKTGSVRRFLLIHRSVKRGKLRAWVFECIEDGPTPYVVIYNE